MGCGLQGGFPGLSVRNDFLRYHIREEQMRLANLLYLFSMALLLPLNSASQRVAWVVGNSDYTDGTLPNPVNDARLVRDSLEALGFRVQLDLNLESADEFGASAQRALLDIRGAEVFLFYYAGHGIQVDNENYLIPTEADPQDEYGVKRECFPVTELIDRYQRAYSDIPIVAVLDACRVNPFERKWSRSYGSGKGLSKMSAPTGSLIAFSTEYGTTAADGNEENSDYALAFAHVIGQPGLSIQEAFQEVRRLVLEASNDTQVPVEQNKLTAQLVLRQLPDLSVQQLAEVFSDFEEVLRRGFTKNSLPIWDSVDEVGRRYEVVKHYAAELDPSQVNLLNRWKHLELFHNLYELQISRGADDEETLRELKRTLEEDSGILTQEVALVATEFIKVVEAELSQESISLDELERMTLSIDELKFTASYQLENMEFPEVTFENRIARHHPHSELINSFLHTEFVLTFESLVRSEYLADVFVGWESESIAKMLEYHRALAMEMSDEQNRVFSLSQNFTALAELSQSDSPDRGMVKGIQKILNRSWIETLSVVFDVHLDVRGFPEVANAVEALLIRLNYLLEDGVIELAPEVEQSLYHFYVREFPKVLDACSGSYFDFYAEGRAFVEHGCLSLEEVLPDDEGFAQDLLGRWDCFVLSYLEDEWSNEMDILLGNFLEKCWLEVDSSFDETQISFASWQALSERHLNLLRLTNKVTTRDFPFSAGRYATATSDTWDNHQLVAFLSECWSVLSLSNDDVFQSFGKEPGEYCIAISGAVGLVRLIQNEDLTCNELIQLQSLLESLLEAHFISYSKNGTPEVYGDIPLLIDALFSCSRQFGYYSSCVIRDYDWYSLDSLNLVVSKSVLSNPAAKQYFNDQEVIDATVEELIELDDFEGLLNFFVTRERLFHDGSLNSTHTVEFVEALQSTNREIIRVDADGDFEFELIHLLWQIVEEASEDLLVARKPTALCEQNIDFAKNAIKRLTTRARDEWNQSVAFRVLVDAHQSHFHRTGRRIEGAGVILESASAALNASRKMGWSEDPQLDYIQAEEYSCLANYHKSIPKWMECMEDSYWDVSDQNQFSQNLFLDLLELNGVSDSLYDQLLRQYGVTASDLSACSNSTNCDGKVLTIRASVDEAWPIVEFTTVEGKSTLLLQLPDLKWRVFESESQLGAIMTRRDTTYVPCHGYSFGQLDIADSESGADIDVYLSQIRRNQFSEWNILLPESLASLADSSSIRTGFYWSGGKPTGHTQDLKYLTYMNSFAP